MFLSDEIVESFYNEVFKKPMCKFLNTFDAAMIDLMAKMQGAPPIVKCCGAVLLCYMLLHPPRKTESRNAKTEKSERVHTN